MVRSTRDGRKIIEQNQFQLSDARKIRRYYFDAGVIS